jgi:hypothetical protein
VKRATGWVWCGCSTQEKNGLRFFPDVQHAWRPRTPGPDIPVTRTRTQNPQVPPSTPSSSPRTWAVSDWAAAFESQKAEHAYWPAVEGTLPRGLVGTLFRNGPGRFERGGARYAHMLDGDGLVNRWTFLPPEEDGEGGGGGGDDEGGWGADAHTTSTSNSTAHPPRRPRGARVHFTSRYVRTRELADEEYAGRVLCVFGFVLVLVVVPFLAAASAAGERKTAQPSHSRALFS